MYLEYYQLVVKPFQITSDPKFLWLGEKHKEALATLRYGIIDNRGFLLLTGEVGTGKTILINQLIKMMDMDTVVATLPDPDLISMDFYNLLADGFGMKRTFDSKGAFLITLRDFLLKSYADNKQVLLIIDESQRLNHFLMEDIRVLSNIELHDRKLINIFFVGQQEFNTLLNAPQNKALAQRITVRYNIAPLEIHEIDQYINHRLRVAGGKKKLFNGNAIEEVYQFSGGIPRLINIICDHALLTGYARGSETIDELIIKECAQELRIPIKSSNDTATDTENAPDSKSIATAIAKTAKTANTKKKIKDVTNLSEDWESHATEDVQKALTDTNSPVLKVFYAFFALFLIGLAAFFITHYTSEEKPRWGAEDLTPNKYRTSLEKEQELLTQKIEMGKTDQDPIEPPSVQKNPDRQDTPPAEQLPIDLPTDEQTESASTGNRLPEPELEPESLPIQADQTIGKVAPLPLMKEKITIHFNLNSNEIEAESYAALDRIADYLVEHPNEKIILRGYTDSSGSSGYNESVSKFRASSVKTYLIGKGTPAQNITALAMGAASPVAPNNTMEGRRRNRRVEIEFDNGSDIAR